MIPSKPHLGTIQVPLAVLQALSKRRLTTSETRVIMAICAHTKTDPGGGIVTYESMAWALGTDEDQAENLIHHAIGKGIVRLVKKSKGTLKLVVQPKSKWRVPG